MTRDQILELLVAKNVIRPSEAQDIRTKVAPDTDQERVLAVIKGEFPTVRPRPLAEALGIAVTEYQDLKATSFDDYQRPRDAEERALASLERAKERGFDFHIGGGEEPSWMSEDFGWGGNKSFASPSEARKFVDEEYNRLKRDGVFSPADEARIERVLNLMKWQNPSPDAINDLVREMRIAGATDDDLVNMMDALPTNYDFNITDPNEAAFLAEKTPTYKGLTSLDPAQQAEALYGADGMVDSSQLSSADYSFSRAAQMAGVTEEAFDVERPDRLGYTGDGTVFDRATGQVLSESEWELIKTNERAAMEYRSRTTVSKAVQALLDSGKFSGTAKSNLQTRTVGFYDPNEGRYVTRDVTEKKAAGLAGRLPIEDLAIPTAVPTGEAWEAPTYDYRVGDGRAEWLQFSARERAMRIKLMEDNGLLSQEQANEMQRGYGAGGNPLNFVAMDIWEQASSVSSQFQYSQLDAILAIGKAKAVQEAGARRSSGGSAQGPTYSVPASLREIPDYKTLAQNTKSIFRGQLGREMEDWEVQLYADALKREHEEANRERIQIHKEAWDDAVAGGSTEIDFTAVEDPNTALDYDIEEAYAGEIDRNIRVEDRANQNRLLMQSISVGQRMI